MRPQICSGGARPLSPEPAWPSALSQCVVVHSRVGGVGETGEVAEVIQLEEGAPL